MTLTDVRAIVFDKDGTLADSQTFLRNLAQRRARLIDAQVPGVQEPLLMAFGADGDRLNPAGLMAVGTRYENMVAAAAYVAETGRDWFASLELARSTFDEADQVFQRKAEQTPPFEGIPALLQTLAEAGVAIGILSSDTTQNVRDFVAAYGFASVVQLAMGVDDRPGKPDPQLLWDACQALQVPLAHALVIGDSAADTRMAAAAGVRSIGVTWGGAAEASLEGATAIAAQVADIRVLTENGE